MATSTWRQFEALIAALLAPMVAVVPPGEELPAGKVNAVYSVLNADVGRLRGASKPYIAVVFENWVVTETSVAKPPSPKVLELGRAIFHIFIYAGSGAEMGEARLLAFDLLDPVRNLVLGARIRFDPNGGGFDNAPMWPIRRLPGQGEGFLDHDSKAGVVVCHSDFYAGGAIRQVA